MIARQLKDSLGEGRILGNIGLAYASLGEFEKAIDYQEQALIIQRRIGDSSSEGNALGNLGNAYYSQGDFREAIVHYKLRLKIARKIGDRRGEASGLAGMGLSHSGLGNVEKAVAYQEQAMAISTLQSRNTNWPRTVMARPTLAIELQPEHDRSWGPDPPKLLHTPDASRDPALAPTGTWTGRTQPSLAAAVGSSTVFITSLLVHMRLLGNSAWQAVENVKTPRLPVTIAPVVKPTI